MRVHTPNPTSKVRCPRPAHLTSLPSPAGPHCPLLSPPGADPWPTFLQGVLVLPASSPLCNRASSPSSAIAYMSHGQPALKGPRLPLKQKAWGSPTCCGVSSSCNQPAPPQRARRPPRRRGQTHRPPLQARGGPAAKNDSDRDSTSHRRSRNHPGAGPHQKRPSCP